MAMMRMTEVLPAADPPFVPFGGPLLFARFVKREKRFLAHMILDDGSFITAHCPNTGSMKTSMEEGAETVLVKASNPARKYPFTWKAILIGGHWVGVDTGTPTRLCETILATGFIPELNAYRNVKREHTLNKHTRIDLYSAPPGLPPLYGEVKNVTLVENGVARFPDAVTQRGLKHLDELSALARAGNRAAMFYVVQRGDGTTFEPARDIDPAYASGLKRASDAGVEIYVIGTLVTPEGVSATGLLPYRL